MLLATTQLSPLGCFWAQTTTTRYVQAKSGRDPIHLKIFGMVLARIATINLHSNVNIWVVCIPLHITCTVLPLYTHESDDCSTDEQHKSSHHGCVVYLLLQFNYLQNPQKYGVFGALHVHVHQYLAATLALIGCWHRLHLEPLTLMVLSWQTPQGPPPL